MKTAHLVLAVALLIAPAVARGQDVAPSLPPAGPTDTPDAPPPAPPIAVRVDRAPNPAPQAAAVPVVLPPPGGTSVEIPLPPKARENASQHFVFQDVTERTQSPVKTLAERRAAVEALRQSLRHRRGSH